MPQQGPCRRKRIGASRADCRRVIIGLDDIPVARYDKQVLVIGDNDVSVPLIPSTDALALKTVKLATGAEPLAQAQ